MGLLEYDLCRRIPGRLMDHWVDLGANPAPPSFGPSAEIGLLDAALDWVIQVLARGGRRFVGVWWSWFDSFEDEHFYIQAIQQAIMMPRHHGIKPP